MTTESRVPLKNPYVAAVLAYLVPGLGHLYQGRVFKALLYAACILGTFFYGMKLGEWKVVYYRSDLPWRKPTNLGYFAQALVGLPALPALVQSKRYFAPANRPPNELPEPIQAKFRGAMIEERLDGKPAVNALAGDIRLQSVAGQLGMEVSGTFRGTLDGEQPAELHVQLMSMDTPIGGEPERGMFLHVVDPPHGRSEFAGRRIEGAIPRRFVDWFQVPMDGMPLERLHGRLGKFWELAVTYTLIAGLLNILAVWDALEGPAYGYGDEAEEGGDSKSKSAEPAATAPPAPAELANRPSGAGTPTKQPAAARPPVQAASVLAEN
jgi:hypothetical protein